MLKNARKLFAYRRDLLGAGAIGELEEAMKALSDALRARDRHAAPAAMQALDETFAKHIPPQQESGWRENTEVFLVAIVIALGVRAYFLQPFTIPTGSMQPTLNGVIGHPTNETLPNPLKRFTDIVLFGRWHYDVVSAVPDTIVEVRQTKSYRFFTRTLIRCEKQQFTVGAEARTLADFFNVKEGRTLAAGEAIVRGHVDIGDHVFVDKISYHFRPPHRGEVFVFNTQGIRLLERDQRMKGVEGSQFYIKRLAGVPGDRLRIETPNLFVNGERGQEAGFQRVMDIRDERAKTFALGVAEMQKIEAKLERSDEGFSMEKAAMVQRLKQLEEETGALRREVTGKFYCGYWGQRLLGDFEGDYKVPAHSYVALGDNSYNSLDSRYWGTVPEQNLMGCGLFVYWPFGKHWGVIR